MRLSASDHSDRNTPANPRHLSDRRLARPRLVALFLLGCLLFNYPVLAVFRRAGDVAGIPALYLWLMGAWAVFIALLAWTAEGSEE